MAPAGPGELKMPRIETGARLASLELTTIGGDRARVPEPGRLVHLQVRGFAGCPMCTTHLRSLALRRDELAEAGITEALIFRSTVDALQEHYADMPFAIVADPAREVCTKLGVESSLRAPLDPHAWAAGLRGAIRNLPRLPTVPPKMMGALGLPADFLVAGDGTVAACNHLVGRGTRPAGLRAMRH
jgi:hypothetical protein